MENKKIQVYIVNGNKSRLTKNIWNRIEHYFEIQEHYINLEDVIKVADKKVHLIIFDNVSSKNISYAAIDAVQQNNHSLHTMIITEETSQKNLTRIYENHIDYISISDYDDDYHVAKLKTIFKRKSPKYQIDINIEFKDITVDRLLSEIKVKDALVDTTKKEYAIIKFLVKNNERFVSKEEIFKKVWGYDEDTSRVLDQYLHRIKKVIANSEAKIVVDRELGIKLI